MARSRGHGLPAFRGLLKFGVVQACVLGLPDYSVDPGVKGAVPASESGSSSIFYADRVDFTLGDGGQLPDGGGVGLVSARDYEVVHGECPGGVVDRPCLGRVAEVGGPSQVVPQRRQGFRYRLFAGGKGGDRCRSGLGCRGWSRFERGRGDRGSRRFRSSRRCRCRGRFRGRPWFRGGRRLRGGKLCHRGAAADGALADGLSVFPAGASGSGAEPPEQAGNAKRMVTAKMATSRYGKKRF